MFPRTLFIATLLSLLLINAPISFAEEEENTPPIPNTGILLPQVGDEENPRDYFAGKFVPHVFGYFISGFGVISLIFFLIGGVMYLVSYGNDEMIGKATKTMQYAVVGFVIALLSYSIVVIINNLAGTFTDNTPDDPSEGFISTKFIIETAYASTEEGDKPTSQDIIGADPPVDSAVYGLPRGDIFATTAKGIIQLILEMSGMLFFVALVVSSVMMIVSRGNDEELKKAKNAILYSIIGLVGIAVSYAIFFGIAEIDFFSDNTPT